MNQLLSFIFSFLSLFSLSQEAYDVCSQALELCPNNVYTVNNIGASATVCTNCEDGFNFCFPTNNTIWMRFTTNSSGGNVQVDFSDLVFENNPGQDNEIQATIIRPSVPCSSNSYTQVGNCVAAASANFQLTATGLLPSTTYYVVVDGDLSGVGITAPAEATFNVSISGTGITRPTPSAQIYQSQTTICEGENILFYVDTINCPSGPQGTLFEWYKNGQLIATTADTVVNLAGFSSGDIVSVSYDCFSNCPVNVTSSSQPLNVVSFIVDAGEDIVATPGEQVTVSGNTTATSFYWSPQYLFVDPQSITTTVSSDKTVTLTLVGTVGNCTKTDQLVLMIDKGLDIPNTFSPNGDGINEKWIIPGIENYPLCELKIYTRWGQEIFSATGYNESKAWNGMIQSRKAAEGVYFYVLDLNDGSDIIKGNLTLIR